VALAVATSAGAAQAASLTIDATDRGWYRSDGFHQPAETNYFVGEGQSPGIFRNFFVFDLSGVSDTITAAELQLQIPVTQFGTSFQSPDGIETYALFDFVGSIPDLVAGVDGVTQWTDLGTGTPYAQIDVTDADDGTVLVLGLNGSALADLNAAGGLFVFGGAITTHDGIAQNIEWIFAESEGLPLSATQLVVTTPEPAAVLLVLGAFGFLGWRRP
jgi:hypothetical protein